MKGTQKKNWAQENAVLGQECQRFTKKLDSSGEITGDLQHRAPVKIQPE